MVSKVVVALCLMLAVTSTVSGQAAGGWGGWGSGWGGVGGGWGGWGGAPAAVGAGAVAAAPANAAANPWIPPWISAAPWYPQWGPCTTIGAACVDCNTKIVCTKIGGIQKACSDPTLPYCNLGECSATPTVECAPVSAVPAPAEVV